MREDHEVIKEGAKEPANTIVAINPDTKTQSVLVSIQNISGMSFWYYYKHTEIQ